jgi:N-glycosylase/DNA lyase
MLVAVQGETTVTREDRDDALRQTRWMLRFDEDFTEFHRLARGIPLPDLTWMRGAGAGRLLRSPRVYEDLVRLICTTNCGWPLTRVMIAALVGRLGEPVPGGGRVFPSPVAMARRPVRFYRDTVRAGYRAAWLRDLALRVAGGELDPEVWADPALPDDVVRESILSVRGAGPYVADNMMKLLGRYAGLGIDSWCRRTFSEMHANGRRVADRRIERFYEPFGRWRGLALWCDITRDWFDERGEPRVGEKLS